MIRAEHLTKRYKKQLAVSDLSFKVETGKVTGFLGPNGAGKSTTMRLMLGLDNGSGTTTFDDKQLHRYGPAVAGGRHLCWEAKLSPDPLSAAAPAHIGRCRWYSTQPSSRALSEVGLSSVAAKGPGKVQPRYEPARLASLLPSWANRNI